MALYQKRLYYCLAHSRFGRRILAALTVVAALLASDKAAALDIAPLRPPTVDAGQPAPTPPRPAEDDGKKKDERDLDKVLMERIVGLRFELFVPPPPKTGEGEAPGGKKPPAAKNAPLPPPEFTGLVNRIPQLDAAFANPQSPLAQAAAELLAMPLTWRRLDAVTAAAADVLRKGGWSLARVFAPAQELSSGALRIAVMPVPLEDVIVEGARWTKVESLRRPFLRGIGKPVDTSMMIRPLMFANEHPFRRVTPAMAPGKAPGTSSLVLNAEEKRPWRLFSGYEITNSRSSGNGRITTGFMAAAPWRTEDIVTAQYSTDCNLSHLTSASVNYTSPLPWGHFLGVTGLWADSVTTPAEPFRQHSRDYMLAASYTIPFEPFAGWTHDLVFGIEWRRSELQKHIAGFKYFDNAFDMTPLSVSYRLRRPDALGHTNLWGEAAIGPGSWSGWRTSSDDYDQARYASETRWAVLRWDVRRDWRLPAGFIMTNRFWGQWTSDRLPDPARMYLGGGRSIRGYRDGEFVGDKGLAVSVEVLSPALPLPGRLKPDDAKKPHPLSVRLAAFWDWGQVRNRAPYDVGEFASKTLQGTGLGIRANYGDRLSLRLDYGWRLKDTGNRKDDKRGYWHGSLQCVF